MARVRLKIITDTGAKELRERRDHRHTRMFLKKGTQPTDLNTTRGRRWEWKRNLLGALRREPQNKEKTKRGGTLSPREGLDWAPFFFRGYSGSYSVFFVVVQAVFSWNDSINYSILIYPLMFFCRFAEPPRRDEMRFPSQISLLLCACFCLLLLGAYQDLDATPIIGAEIVLPWIIYINSPVCSFSSFDCVFFPSFKLCLLLL